MIEKAAKPLAAPASRPTPVLAPTSARAKSSPPGGNGVAAREHADAPPIAASGGGGGGQSLSEDLRAKFESSLATDLSKVRVHTDTPVATGAGARAIAHGQDIHMAPGEYDPRSAVGEKLLAHEVAHTVQQQRATPHPQAKGDRPAPARSSAEHDADQAADAMVAGKPASVSAVSEQQPHATEQSRGELLQAYNGSLAKQNWADVALRLNGFSSDDITMLVGKMTGGQHAHVREAAEVAMPGWSQRVTGAIDAADANASRIATLYAAYEKALAAAKTSGDWREVIERLNGMGSWDMQDRLKKLTWFDYEAMRAQTDNARVLDAINKADTARVERPPAAYQDAIASHNTGGPTPADVAAVRAKLVAARSLLADKDAPLSDSDRKELETAIANAETALHSYDDLAGQGQARTATMAPLKLAGAFIVGNDVTVVGSGDDWALPLIGIGMLLVLLMTRAPANDQQLAQAWSKVTTSLQTVAAAGEALVLLKINGDRLRGNTKQLAAHLARLLALASVAGVPSGEPPKNNNDNDPHWWKEIIAFLKNIQSSIRNASRAQVLRELGKKFTEEQILEIERLLAEAAKRVGEPPPPFLPPP